MRVGDENAVAHLLCEPAITLLARAQFLDLLKQRIRANVGRVRHKPLKKIVSSREPPFKLDLELCANRSGVSPAKAGHYVRVYLVSGSKRDDSQPIAASTLYFPGPRDAR